MWSDAAHQVLAKQINQFTQDLLASHFQNTLTQYGEIGGAGSGAFIKASYLAGVPQTLTVQSYQQIIQQCINANAFPQPVDPATTVSVPILMIYLDQHTTINGGGRQLNIPNAGDLAYHDSFVASNGHPCIYAFHAALPINSLTWVASHEFAEAVTDPLYNAWTPDHAGHEIGDYCEGSNATITVSGRTWTVQTLWSNHDKACIAPPANPIAALPGGPNGAAGGQGVTRGFAVGGTGAIASHERLLPLPSVHFDVEQSTHKMDEVEVRAYARKLFHPMRHEAMFGDFAGFLHGMADALQQASASASGVEYAGQSEDVGRAPGVARNAGTCKICPQIGSE